jgi:hypothetical protein
MVVKKKLKKQKAVVWWKAKKQMRLLKLVAETEILLTLLNSYENNHSIKSRINYL